MCMLRGFFIISNRGSISFWAKVLVPRCDRPARSYLKCVQNTGVVGGMPRIAVEKNTLRISGQLLMRAVALNHTDLTDFIM